MTWKGICRECGDEVIVNFHGLTNEAICRECGCLIADPYLVKMEVG